MHAAWRSSNWINQNSIWTNFLINFNKCIPNKLKPNQSGRSERDQSESVWTPFEHSFQSESIPAIRRSSNWINQNSIWTNFLINFNKCIPNKLKPNQSGRSEKVQSESVGTPSEYTFQSESIRAFRRSSNWISPDSFQNKFSHRINLGNPKGSNRINPNPTRSIF